MESSIQIIAGVSFLVVGLSHLFRPRVWAQFFIDLRERGEVARLHEVADELDSPLPHRGLAGAI